MTGESEGHEAIVAQINVTPLIDVFLVMVVIFMESPILASRGRASDLSSSGPMMRWRCISR